MCETTEPWRSRSPICQACRDQLEREGTCIRCRKHPAIQDHPKRICYDCKTERSSSKRRRDARREAGLCATCDTPSEAYRCDTCIEPPRKAMKVHRARKLAEGKCTICLRVPSLSGGRVCESCLNRVRLRYTRKRQAVLDAYGRQCACCAESDVTVLDLDHVAPHWVASGSPRPDDEVGVSLYEKAIEADYPANYQLLCRNCNWSKRLHGACRMSHTRHAACFLVNVGVGTYRRRAALRRDIITGYGGMCSGCQLDDLDVLDVDHVQGGGRLERRQISHYQLWSRLRREHFPNGYRLLCRNCNWRAWRLRQRAAARDTLVHEPMTA